jgi:hypothetical protein
MSATKDLLTGRGGRVSQLDELLAEIRAYHATTSAFMAHLQGGGITNGVLEVATDNIPTGGALTRSYHVQCGSLLVVNAGGGAVTISAGPPGPSAPQVGPGVQILPAQSFLAVPINHHAWTVWGTVGQNISWQAFTGLQSLGVSL